ncbi:hypothetical protein [Dethiothermospora halolimnae]|uniref:hypothetical protein n=1 Tax=Dethiothermospora halolimnae TaxID=3114390 RepID=UPI003CCBB6A8
MVRRDFLEILKNECNNIEKYFYLIHTLSDVKVKIQKDTIDNIISGFNKSDKDFDFDNEILEARFFNENHEYFIYRVEDGFKVVTTSHNCCTNDGYITREYLLNSRFSGSKRMKLIFREYLSYEDHLAYPSRTCLYDIREVY